MSRALTEAEEKVLGQLTDASNGFLELPTHTRLQGADAKDFCAAIRAAQNIVLARPATEAQLP